MPRSTRDLGKDKEPIGTSEQPDSELATKSQMDEMKKGQNLILETVAAMIGRLSVLEAKEEKRQQPPTYEQPHQPRYPREEERVEDEIRGNDGVFGDFRGHQQRGWNENLPKSNIPIFKGSHDVDEYLDWKDEMERFFKLFPYTEPRKVDVSTSEFKEFAAIWWKEQERKRRAGGYPELTSWAQLVHQMDLAFIPVTYERDVNIKLQWCKQGNKSVREYYHELIKWCLKAKVQDDDLKMQARFLQGLNPSIRHQLDVLDFESVSQMLQKAIIVEDHDKEASREKNKQYGTGSFKGNKGYDKRPFVAVSTQTKKFEAKVKEGYKSDQEKKGTNVTRSSRVECFKCQGRGHYANSCPNVRTMVIKGGQIVSESEGEEDEENSGLILHSSAEKKELDFKPFEESSCEEDSDGERYHQALVVSRALNVQPNEDKELLQRKNIFHTRAKVNNKVCLVIVDGGSCTNCISSEFVDRVKLPTEKHDEPYKLLWLDDRGEIKVNKKARVFLNFGHFVDEVVCDVIPMSACHVLLGRPWEFDKRVVKDGYTNVYKVHVDAEITCNLLPLSPSEILKSQKKIQEGRGKSQNCEVKETKESLGKVRESKESECKKREKPKESERKGSLVSQKGNLGRALHMNQPMLLLMFQEVYLTCTTLIDGLPRKVQSVLQELKEVFKDELPSGLPPIRGIEHQIDLIPGAQIPNRPAYKATPTETKELQKQVEELLVKGKVRESLSPCAVPVILVPKKTGDWRIVY